MKNHGDSDKVRDFVKISDDANKISGIKNGQRMFFAMNWKISDFFVVLLHILFKVCFWTVRQISFSHIYSGDGHHCVFMTEYPLDTDGKHIFDIFIKNTGSWSQTGTLPYVYHTCKWGWWGFNFDFFKF